MTGGRKENPGARAAQPKLRGRYAEAAGTSNVTRGKGLAKRADLHHIRPEGGAT